jgi:membrane-associated protease RseP (regulator of RpoE activity)
MDAHLPPTVNGRLDAVLRTSVLAFAAAALVTRAAADEPPASSPAFQPGEISIGEPIALPFGGPAAATPPTPAATPTPAPRAAGDGGSVPGNGWLGLSVDESTVPGRWRVEAVAPDGPAAQAGIAVGDELRAVNGGPLASREEVSQALTAIAVGQDVRVAVARADNVTDRVLRAAPRPAAPPRFATPVAPTPVAPTPVTTPSAPNPQWQAAVPRDPEAPESRFGPPASPTPATLPTPVATPIPAAAVDLPAPATQPPATASALAAAPAPAAMPQPTAGRKALGVRTVPIDPATQARFNLPAPTGAYVIGVVQDLPAAKAGVPPGSVIVAIDDQPVRSPVELTKLVTSGPLDQPVTVQFVLPGGEAKKTAVRLQALDPPLARALTDDGPTPVPAPGLLQPGPSVRRAERPAVDEPVIRAEIRAMRARLERLEQLLDPRSRRGD